MFYKFDHQVYYNNLLNINKLTFILQLLLPDNKLI